MKIVSVNGWGGRLYSDFMAYVAAEQPDVLCVQEVVHTPEFDGEWLLYRDGDHELAQRANFFSELAAALPHHAATFCPAARGPLWNGHAALQSHWGLATFVRRSMPVIGQVQAFVHKTYSPDGYGGHPRPRNAHGLRLHDHVRKRSVSITHMHGLRDLRGKLDTPEREEQARRLLAICEQVSQPGDVRIVCGDFNVQPDSATLRKFRGANFTELVTARGFEGTRTSYYTKAERHADYMLISSIDAVVDFKVAYEPEISDHCPLVLTI